MTDMDVDNCSISSDTETLSDELLTMIDELIERSENLNNEINKSFETIHNIHTQIDSNDKITVKYNGTICDFEEVLDNIHNKALESGKYNFGELLLEYLKSTF